MQQSMQPATKQFTEFKIHFLVENLNVIQICKRCYSFLPTYKQEI